MRPDTPRLGQALKIRPFKENVLIFDLLIFEIIFEWQQNARCKSNHLTTLFIMILSISESVLG